MSYTRFLGGLLAAAIPTTLAGQAERVELRGEHVAIYNLAGNLTVEAGGGSAVVLEITRGGRDGSRLTLARGAIRDRETLRVLYPGDQLVYARDRSTYNTSIHVQQDGTFGDQSWRERRNERRQVTVRSSGNGLEAHADIRVLIPRGQRVSMYWGVGEATVTNVDGRILVDGASTTVRTSGTRGELVVDIGSGSVDVTNAEGEVDIDTGSGSVRVTGVRGRRLRVDTGSGRVTASAAEVDDLNIDTGSGSISVDHTTAREIRLDTGSGSIDVAVTNNAQTILIDTGSGSVTLSVPEGLGAQVEIETGSGGIDLDMPLTVRRWSRNHVVGQLGDGRGRIVIDTGSGGIRIRRR